MDNTTLPQELSSSIGSEKMEFAVKAGRAQPLKKSLSLIVFGTLWTTFASVCGVAFFGPLLSGEEVHFKLNGVSTIANINNLGSILMPSIVTGIFILIGLVMLSSGIYFIFKKGGYFVGTPERLVQFQNGTLRSMDWEQFSGDIEVSGNPQNGDISLQMRTGRLVHRKHGPDRFVPDIIYISEIPNVFGVEQICRKRIKENDPTPSVKSAP